MLVDNRNMERMDPCLQNACNQGASVFTIFETIRKELVEHNEQGRVLSKPMETLALYIATRHSKL